MEVAATMSIADIEDTIRQFAASAKAAKDLGFDCLEIHGAHGYLIDQFSGKVLIPEPMNMAEKH